MTTGEMTVRAAGTADLEALLGIERAAATAPHWAAAEYAACLEVGSAAGAARLSYPPSNPPGVRRRLLVAERDGAVVGFAVGAVVTLGDEVQGELESVAVAATARRMGVGAALCGAVVGWCAEQGAAAVELEVRGGSAGAIALYAGLGFVEVGRRPAYYRNPSEDAVLMRRELRPAEMAGAGPNSR